MNVFDAVIRSVEDWLDRLDRERDLATRLVAREGRRPHLVEWLDQLDRERAKHVELVARLRALQRENHPALLLPARPTRVLKAVKASLRRERRIAAS